MEKLALTQEWDKTFPKSEKLTHSIIPFDKLVGFFQKNLK